MMEQAMRTVASLVALFLVVGTTRADEQQAGPKPLPLELERKTISSGGSDLDILVRHDAERRPVLVLVPGSACMPAFMLVQQDQGFAYVSSALPPDVSDLTDLGAHLAILERRNIRSYREIYREDEIPRLAQLDRHACTGHHGGVTLEQRADDVRAQLDYLVKQDWAGPVLMAGTSEGSDVATFVASAPQSPVRALLLVVGGGMSQFFDAIHQRRNEDDHAGVAEAFADLDAFLSDHPPAEYQGLPAERWHSFAITHTNLDSLLGSDVPLFVVHGDKDASVPVASVDALVVEVMRRQPVRPVYYLNVSGAGHNLHEALSNPAHSIYPKFVHWISDDPHGRTYEAIEPDTPK